MKAALNLQMTHIPYRGTGQSVPALLGGHVQVLFSAYPSLVGAVESKKVKLLATQRPGPLVPGAGRSADRRRHSGLRSDQHRRHVRQARHAAAHARQDRRGGDRCGQHAGGEAAVRRAGIETAGGDGAVFDKALKREIDNVNAVVKSAGIEPQ